MTSKQDTTPTMPQPACLSRFLEKKTKPLIPPSTILPMEPKGLLSKAPRAEDLYVPHPLSDITNIAESEITTTVTGISLQHKTSVPSIDVTIAKLYYTVLFYALC